jgi:hypothetical protein
MIFTTMPKLKSVSSSFRLNRTWFGRKSSGWVISRWVKGKGIHGSDLDGHLTIAVAAAEESSSAGSNSIDEENEDEKGDVEEEDEEEEEEEEELDVCVLRRDEPLPFLCGSETGAEGGRGAVRDSTRCAPSTIR